MENDAALLLLPSRLAALDASPTEGEDVMEGILGGNVFDWGASEVREYSATCYFSLVPP